MDGSKNKDGEKSKMRPFSLSNPPTPGYCGGENRRSEGNEETEVAIHPEQDAANLIGTTVVLPEDMHTHREVAEGAGSEVDLPGSEDDMHTARNHSCISIIVKNVSKECKGTCEEGKLSVGIFFGGASRNSDMKSLNSASPNEEVESSDDEDDEDEVREDNTVLNDLVTEAVRPVVEHRHREVIVPNVENTILRSGFGGVSRNSARYNLYTPLQKWEYDNGLPIDGVSDVRRWAA
ncbi:hypothetical protein M758_UG011600 [Ceratodon purpureus]|nr:hypothetical protein M758_UG011600 [Ceratodon purpureus]